MSDLVAKIPFLRLLLPAVAAIAVSAFGIERTCSWVICLAGAGGMGLSFFIPVRRQFACRWLFGAGLFVFVFGLFSFLCRRQEAESRFCFPDNPVACIGTVVDVPREKPRSFACHVKISYPVSRKIVAYLQKEERARNIVPGDEIVFVTRIRPFRNFGNPDDFDYVGFMRNNGFSGSAYLPSSNWHPTGRKHLSPYVSAQKLRKKALEFYRMLELDNDAYAFVSALTLGYKHDLTNGLREAFRASGTSHVLAVSGLHVGIVYGIFAFLFSFLGKRGARFVLKQLIVIAALWLYAFVTGLSPSVLRATLMLTMASLGWMGGRRGFTLNALAAAAFFILLFHPMSLFNVGFQMSFMAVLGILSLNPLMDKWYRPKSGIGKSVWALFSLSISAQAGVLPIALHHFGTFPTYFFIANMLVVPLIGLILHTFIPALLLAGLKSLHPVISDALFPIFGWVMKTLILVVLAIVRFIETLPYAQLSGNPVSALQMICLLLIAVAVFQFFTRKRVGILMAGLACSLLLAMTFTYAELSRKPPRLAVFNNPGFSDIGLYADERRVYFDVKENGFIPHPSKSILRLSENIRSQAEISRPLEIDVLILSHDRTFTIKQLVAVFLPGEIVLDSSIPGYARNRLARECEELGISCHDVEQDGAYLINL